MVHSFLLIGQSNAAGRGFLGEAEPLDTCRNKLKVLRNGRWQTIYRPVNPDRAFSGYCFAESFAKAYSADHPDVEVGIIPCADGGTTLTQWQPGGLLFDNALSCAKLAMRTSCLVGVLWHQGESDCHDDRYPHYRARFAPIMTALRQDLGLPHLPFLLGGLGDYLVYCTGLPELKNYHHVNAALEQIALNDPYCAFVPANGLASNPDNLHINTASLKEFGLRYYQAFTQLDGQNAPDTTQTPGEDTQRSAIELL